MLAAIRRARRLRVGLALLLLELCEVSASAGDARLIIDFLSTRGSAPFVPRFTLEMGEVSRGAARLPRFTLVSADSGPQITQYMSELPRVTIGRLSFAPNYGDQRLAVDLPAASLAGMGIDARPLRGLSLIARAKESSLSIAVGQVGTREPGVLGSAVPRVISVASTIKAHRRVLLAPRFIMPIGRASAPGAAATGLGAGGRVEVAPHLALVGDVGTTRLSGGEWAHSAAGGLLSGWRRAAFELSVVRADRNYTLLGPVAFAGLDRETMTSRVTIRPGQTISGHVGRARSHGRSQPQAGGTTGSLVWQAEHVSGGTLTAAYDRHADRLRRINNFRVEWQGAPAGWASTVRLVVGRDARVGSGHEAPTFRELFVQLQPPPALARWIAFDGRATVALSDRLAGTPRVNWRIVSRIALTERLSVGTETDGVFGGGAIPVHRVSTLRLAAELAISKKTSVRVSYGQAAGVPTRLMQRLEGRIVRTLAF